MAKIKKDQKRELPAISTASLPDIIFILLFFFMVVTVMRESEIKVKQNLPSATELTKLEDKKLVQYLYIGEPIQKYAAIYGTAPKIQLNDKFVEMKEVGPNITAIRNEMSSSDQGAMIVALRIDEEVKMGIVADVKFELRKADALKINYSSKRREEY